MREEPPPRKVTDVIMDINKIFAYSAIKIKENPTEPYSTLNPETSSDSPSAKSNGVRFVSARRQDNHIPKRGGNIKADQEIFRGAEISTKDKEDLSMALLNKIRPKHTSYEMVWAIARMAPSNEYLELEAQPARIIG